MTVKREREDVRGRVRVRVRGPNMAQLQLVEFERLATDDSAVAQLQKARHLVGDRRFQEAYAVLHEGGDPYVLRARAYVAGIIDGLAFAAQEGS